MGYSLFYHEVFFNGIIRVMKIIGIRGLVMSFPDKTAT